MRWMDYGSSLSTSHMTFKMAAPLLRFGVRSISRGLGYLKVHRQSSTFSHLCCKPLPSTVNAVCKCNLSFRLGTAIYRCHSTSKDDRKCWKCNAKTNEKAELFFCNCGVVQKVPTDLSYFEVMECPEIFNIDVTKLPDLYKERQRNLHPDKFAQKSKVHIY